MEAYVGDKVICNNHEWTICKIYGQDYWEGHGWRIEFEDTNGCYHHWKQELDGGELKMKEPEHWECVESCPCCDFPENIYEDYSPEKDGYIVNCKNCGCQIHLCDECLHSDDNPGQRCDWREEENGEKIYGICFRGTTINDKRRLDLLFAECKEYGMGIGALNPM